MLDEDGEALDEGAAARTSQATFDLFAALRRQPADERVYGLLWNTDTGHVTRFDRVRPGCYRARRAG